MCLAIRLKRVEREAELNAWLPTSNVWDDREETFVINFYDGFRKEGVNGAKKDQFHVIWKLASLMPTRSSRRNYLKL